MRSALVIAVLLIASALPAHAQTVRTVTSTADSGPGSLRETIQAMTVDGTVQRIVFAVPTGSTITLLSALPTLVGTQVEVDGSAVTGLVIDGAGSPMFVYSGQQLTMRGLHLRGGRSTGGGCVNVNTTLQAQFFDMAFTGCSTDGTAASGSGGGAIRAFGALRITRGTFIGNIARDGGLPTLSLGGGAVSVNGTTSTLIEDSRFDGNRLIRTLGTGGGCTDGVGGAISLAIDNQGSALIRRSRFENNDIRCGSADGNIGGQAGALFAIGAGTSPAPTLSIDATYFGGNRSGNGGAMFLRAVRALIDNTSFYENNGGSGAGTIFLTSGFGASPPTPEMTVRSSAFWRNATSSTTFGADLHVNTNAGAVLRELRNTVFAPTAAGAHCVPAVGDITAGAVVFTTDASCFYFVGGNPISSQFAATNTFGLQAPNPAPSFLPALVPTAGSVLIDNGFSTGCPTRDAWSLPRPVDGDADGNSFCDVGAIEFREWNVFRDSFE